MRVAVQGCGRWGKNWVRVLNDILGPENVVAVDPAVEGCLSEVPYDEVDAVVVATPTEDHVDSTVEALYQGKHVMVEKPMALSHKEAVYLCEMADVYNCVLMTDHIMLVHPAFKGIASARRYGALQVRRILARRTGTVPREGGLLWNLGPHDLSMALELLDEPLHVWTHRKEGFIKLMCHWQAAEAGFTYSIAGPKRRAFMVNDDFTIDGTKPVEPEPLRLMADAFIRSCEAGKAEVASGKSALPIIRILEEATA